MLKTVILSFVFLISLAVTIICLFPMSVAADLLNLKRTGFVYEDAYGTIWKGGFTKSRIVNQPIGKIDLVVDVGSFITLSPKINVAVRGQPGIAKGRIVASFSGIEIQNFTADINIQELRYLEPTLRQVPSKLSFEVKSFKFGFKGECLGGRSTISTDILSAAGRQWQWEGPAMEGQITCSKGAPLVELNESSGADKITVSAAPVAGGGVLSRAQVRTVDGSLARALRALGFVLEDGVYNYEKVRGIAVSSS